MCTPWTLTRFVRWRVKDLASCFLACRFPLEGETETRHSASSQVPIANMVFETHDDTGGDYNNKKSKKRLSRRNRGNNGDRQVNPSPTVENENGSGGGGGDNSSWRGFSDEEYIVFCFREDGAFDVVKDYKSSEEYIHSRKSSSPQKLNNAAEDAERDNNKQSSNEGIRSNEEEVINIPAKEGDGEGNSSICLEIELGSGSLRRRRLRSQSQVEGTPNQGVASVESSDSNQSDGSTGSFAFPVLGWEWMGSPVQMPKLDSDSEGEEEGMSPSKNKALSVRFQCLRF